MDCAKFCHGRSRYRLARSSKRKVSVTGGASGGDIFSKMKAARA